MQMVRSKRPFQSVLLENTYPLMWGAAVDQGSLKRGFRSFRLKPKEEINTE